jgi:hypothetical protein
LDYKSTGRMSDTVHLQVSLSLEAIHAVQLSKQSVHMLGRVSWSA